MGKMTVVDHLESVFRTNSDPLAKVVFSGWQDSHRRPCPPQDTTITLPVGRFPQIGQISCRNLFSDGLDVVRVIFGLYPSKIA